jgi:hypothetical protein
MLRLLSDQGVDQFKKLIVPVFNVGGKFETGHSNCMKGVADILNEIDTRGLEESGLPGRWRMTQDNEFEVFKKLHEYVKSPLNRVNLKEASKEEFADLKNHLMDILNDELNDKACIDLDTNEFMWDKKEKPIYTLVGEKYMGADRKEMRKALIDI